MVSATKTLLAQEKISPIRAEAIRPLYGQPLFFLGKGKQCLAYETADGKFVLKLFKKASQKKKSQKAVFEGLLGGVLAQTVLPEHTGVIACSCGPQTIHMPTVVVLNEKGKVEKINLQETPFILQRKALPFKQTLLKLVHAKNMTAATSCLESLFIMLSTCRDRGIVDRDGSLIRNGNIGCIGGKVVLMDTGKLCRLSDRKRITLHDVNRLKPLLSWLETASPELIPTFKTLQKNYLSSCEKMRD